MDTEARTRSVTWLTLLTSSGTLVCCALPALFVSIGAGATMAAITSHVPALVWLSEHKDSVFALAGAMLLAAGVMQWRARSLPCPADPALARVCTRARVVSRSVYLFALAVYGVGALFAYVLPALNA